MQTKTFIFLIIALLFLTAPLVLHTPNVKAEGAGTIQPLPGITIDPEKTPEETLDNWKNNTISKWDYLAKQWQTMIKNNPAFASLDKFFTTFDFIFIILFAEHYSISLILLFVIILWIFTAVIANNYLEAGLFKSKLLAFLSGVAFATILAQTKLYRIIIVALGNLIYSNEAWWARLLIEAAIVVAIIVFFYLNRQVSAIVGKMKKIKKEKENEQEIKNSEEFRKGVKEGIKLTKD